jgi:hypothetical protein
MRDQDAALEIIAMERGALERGARGDVDSFVNISDPDVVYFDPSLDRRIDGLAALKEYYHSNWKPPEEEFDIELINPNRARTVVELHGGVSPDHTGLAHHPDALVVDQAATGCGAVRKCCRWPLTRSRSNVV